MNEFLMILLIIQTIICQYVSLKEETTAGTETILNDLQSKAKTNSCMKAALELLKTNCKSMTDDDQSKLAIILANCHFQKSGKEIFPCNDSMSILECTQNMVGDSWNTYTEFYTHASNFCVPIESICFYISTEIWQENTENIINELTTLSLKLSKDLYHMEIIIEEMN